jgi:serine/threonine-protein kinase RsbW
MGISDKPYCQAGAACSGGMITRASVGAVTKGTQGLEYGVIPGYLLGMDHSPPGEFEAANLILRHKIAFAADLRRIAPVVDQVMQTVREMKCAEGKEFEIETALREALVNAVVHGCKADMGKSVECCVACDESRGILLIVRDSGQGFDPAGLPDPLVGENLFASHGRGIYMINQLMDEVSFQRGGAEIRMRKR